MLLSLQVSKTTGLSMNLLDLAATIGVELDNLLASRSVGSLLKVRVETQPEIVGSLSDSIALISGLGAVAGMVLAVETLEGGEETVRDTVLGVELDAALNGGVTHDVALGKVLC